MSYRLLKVVYKNTTVGTISYFYGSIKFANKVVGQGLPNWTIKPLLSSIWCLAKWKMVKAACFLFTAPFVNFLYCCHIIVCSFKSTNLFYSFIFFLSLQGKFQQARQLKLKKSGRLTLPGVNTSKVQKPKTRSSRVR